MTGNLPDPLAEQTTDGDPGLPPWVKLLALGIAAAVLVMIVVMLLVGGEHGPGMHGG